MRFMLVLVLLILIPIGLAPNNRKQLVLGVIALGETL
jgi:hypothetical protein